MKVFEKIAVITGGSSGFGRSLGHRLASKGAKVVLADISTEQGITVANEINQKFPNSAVFCKVDVTSVQDIKKMFDVAISKFGGIDIVINNAGIGESIPFSEDLQDTNRRVIEIDLIGVILGTRHAVTYFINEKKPGVVINTASLAGLYPQPMQPVYAAAKGGVVHFTRSLATLKDDHGIRAVAICPSFSPTALLQKIVGDLDMLKGQQLVTVELVTDAFLLAIEDERFNGDCIRITPELGIDTYSFRRQKSRL